MGRPPRPLGVPASPPRARSAMVPPRPPLFCHGQGPRHATFRAVSCRREERLPPTAVPDPLRLWGRLEQAPACVLPPRRPCCVTDEERKGLVTGWEQARPLQGSGRPQSRRHSPDVHSWSPAVPCSPEPGTAGPCWQQARALERLPEHPALSCRGSGTVVPEGSRRVSWEGTRTCEPRLTPSRGLCRPSG